MSLPHPAGVATVDAIVFNGLWLPGHRPVFVPATIEGGQQLVAGSVLGRVTATGKLKLAKAAAGDGSQVPYAILPENVASFDKDGTTALDMTMSVATHCYVNASAIYYDSSFTWLSLEPLLRAVGIFARTPGYSG